MMMWRIPLSILSSAGVRRVLEVEEMTVMVIVLRKRKRKKIERWSSAAW
jgi:RNA polymerase-interacting CarD/CdnL/TRCF family regulator